jgi:hypothetical protein
MAGRMISVMGIDMVDAIMEMKERLARLEEVQRSMQDRQKHICDIVEKQACNLGEWVERISMRVSAIESVWAKILGAATVISILFSFIFDWIKSRLTSH